MLKATDVAFNVWCMQMWGYWGFWGYFSGPRKFKIFLFVFKSSTKITPKTPQTPLRASLTYSTVKFKI